ncbi:hypothetical protein [Rhizobium sp. N122]|uniref:hypothetical protein n=1 Tax=Rhizobium sp. N122 TaxID=1764272 RepID=UPI00117B47A9|nr:hypothetical protein [Rhizobium sp. N122]
MADLRLCSIPDCGNARKTKCYCNAHYKRLRRHGNPLGGRTRTPNGELLPWIHEVALHHTGTDCLTWPFGRGATKDYGMLRVDDKMVYTHRYICELVHGSPPTPDHDAAHSCGKGHEGCVAPGHLDWKTRAENVADTLVHGTRNRGERNGQAKLTEADVRIIIALNGTETRCKMADRFGVSSRAIADIHRGRRWAWLSEQVKRAAE